MNSPESKDNGHGASWDRVFSDLKVLTDRDYDGCDSATLVVRKKGMSAMCHPIIYPSRNPNETVPSSSSPDAPFASAQ